MKIRIGMVDIYVLELEDGNVYVGKTNRGKKRLEQHIKGRGAEWTKLHKPKRVMAYYQGAKDSDEQKVTNQMIRKYGAKKVRGGNITKRKMSKSEIDKLNKDLGFKQSKKSTSTVKKKTTTKKKSTTTKKKSTTYTCSRCGRQGHNKTQCYAKTTARGAPISKPKKTTTRKRTTAKRKTTKSASKSSKPAWARTYKKPSGGRPKNLRRRR